MPAQFGGSTSPARQSDHSVEERSPRKRRKHRQSTDTTRAREVGLMRDGTGSIPSSFVGSASGIHFIRSVYGALGSSTVDKTSPEHTLVPGEDDRLAAGSETGSPKPIWREGEVNDKDANPSGEAFSFDDIVDWSSHYFDAWHPAYPLLHAPSVLSSFEKLAAGNLNEAQSWEVRVIAKALISISLADHRQSGHALVRPIPQDLLFRTFDAALESIQPALTRPATLLGLQAVICVQLFLVSMLRLNGASRLGGLTVRMAFQLGLHRCPTRYPNFTSETQQLRKRVFWSAYCIERHICHALGLPLTIRDDDVDVCNLDKEQHDGHEVDRFSKSKKKVDLDTPVDNRLQLLTFLSKHAKIRGSIMELRNKRITERDESSDAAVMINAELMHWWNDVEDWMDQAETQFAAVSQLHKVVLETLKNESIIALNRPLLAAPKQTPAYEGAIHSCIGAARSIISALHGLSSASASLMWPSFTWAVWMSAFIMLYSATEGQIPYQIAVRSMSRSLKVLHKLAARGSVWPHACAMAIEELRSRLDQSQDDPPSLETYGSKTRANTNTIRPATSDSGPTVNKPFAVEPPMNHTRVEVDQPPTSKGRSNGFATDRTQRYDGNTMTPNIRPPNSEPPWVSGPTNVDATNPLSRRMSIFGGLGFGGAYSTQSAHARTESQLPGFSASMPTWPELDPLMKDMPPISLDMNTDPFQGFDIPFWLGQDKYEAWVGNET